MIYYIIPARKNSKGFRHKNRFLFEKLPKELINENVIVTSDDEVIEQMNDKLYGFDFIKRPNELAEDTTSIKPVLEHIVSKYELKPEDELVVLYLTYPERTYNDIKNIISFYNKHKGKSLLCKEPLYQHPYLCFYEKGINGERIIDHNMYRRQDYPKCFFGSHYVAIVNVEFLPSVDFNLHNKETLFYDLGEHKIDVDNKTDLPS
tara:strand:- start:184 stop:798 length:615 start_codon:yes stop_codon:yes gene_type:complete